MANLNYKKYPVNKIGYFDTSNGTLKDLKKDNILENIRWITTLDWHGSPSIAIDVICEIEQAASMFGLDDCLQFVYEFEGVIKKIKNSNHLN